MHDISLMKKLSDKALWLRISPHIKEHAVSKETWNVLSTVGNYYLTYPSATSIHWKDFAFFFFTVKKVKSEEYDVYRNYFDNVEKAEDSAVLEDVLKNYIVKDYATQILNVAMDVCTDGDKSIDDVQNILDQYKKEIVTTIDKENVFVPTGLSTTLSTVATGGYNWRLNEMNVGAGPLRTGDFVILAARPETGKTTFIASELSFFASQLKDDRPIVWVNNEEGGSKVMNRVIQAYFGVPLSSLIEHEAEYDARYKAEVGDRIRIINDDAGLNNVRRLNALFEDVNPSIIVFDQLDKVHGFEKGLKTYMTCPPVSVNPRISTGIRRTREITSFNNTADAAALVYLLPDMLPLQSTSTCTATFNVSLVILFLKIRSLNPLASLIVALYNALLCRTPRFLPYSYLSLLRICNLVRT